MAAEKTDPKIGLIVGVAVASIGTFLGLHSLLVSYYDIEEHAELQAKILGQPAADLHRQRDSERTRLENGAVPITQAMELMARGGRPQVIEPTGSVDFAPMQGWMQRPRHFTPPPSVSAPSPTPPAGAAPAMQGGPSGDGVRGAVSPVAPTTAAPTVSSGPSAATAAPAPRAAPATTTAPPPAAPTEGAPPPPEHHAEEPAPSPSTALTPTAAESH